MEQSQVVLVDSVDRVGEALEKINNNLARISRQLADLTPNVFTGRSA